MTSLGAPARAGRREWTGLAVLCLPTMLSQVDINVLILALPQLTADLGTSATQQLWVTDIYGFMIAGFLLTMGTLGDRVGHRRVLMAGAVGFIAASLLAAYSSSTEMLLVARALLGIAAATVMPSVLALIRRMFQDPKQLGAAFGIWGSSIMLGVMFGPAIGGLLLNSFWWGSVFLLGVPVMLLLLAVGPALLPESRTAHASRLDLVSVLLSLAAVLPVVWGLKEFARAGWGPEPVLAVIVGVTLAALFVTRQRRLTEPLLDLELFRNKVFTTVVVTGLAIGAVMAGTGLVVTLYLQLVVGLSPLEVGLWLLVPSFAMIVGSNVGPAVARAVRPAYVIGTGLFVAAAGMLLLSQVDPGATLTLLIVGLVLVFTGNSPTGTLGSFLLMSSTPPHRAGVAGSISSAGGELGIALGIALMGSVAAANYRTDVALPAGLPGEAADQARESIAGAASAANGLPTPVAAEVLNAARAAFTDSLHTVSLVNAVLFLAVATLVLVTLRHAPAMGAAKR